MPPQYATRGSPLCSPPNRTSPTAVLSPGSDVACPFPSYTLQFSAQEVLAPSVAVVSFHPSTWYPTSQNPCKGTSCDLGGSNERVKVGYTNSCLFAAPVLVDTK